jgi:hypothetical protein
MTNGDILFFVVFIPLALVAMWRSGRGDGVEVPRGKRLTALAIVAVIFAAIGEFLVLTR